ncbi:BlaI/MecI/CopY family transcriptional regulator [Desulfitobacterium chlororespirans]|uniref:Predicted transcriptional regulator n=1 Tax=Desulfitobacterium chlororespirans DSM 11544 TaxID=1121395 RepID=A0A1M7UQP2_9FIRM|nr:BlaI/MecI/CopY family transcriptional regulator [Desulfitobacterium chlororespirans]SHN85206.1 Predicted transcriptional regulator [Desulfitobacterium chlororespirans DSM 11544]
MTSPQKLPDSELEIMMLIWDAEEKVTSDYLMQRLAKAWQKTTVLNFLNRLCERGFLTFHKEGRLNIYEPLVEKEDYLRNESRTFLRKMHRDSLASLVASLYDGRSVSKEDLAELKRFIEEAE